MEMNPNIDLSSPVQSSESFNTDGAHGTIELVPSSADAGDDVPLLTDVHSNENELQSDDDIVLNTDLLDKVSSYTQC